MADDDLDEGDDVGDEEMDDLDEEGGGSSKGGKKKLILLILLPLLLVIGGTTGAYFAGLLDPVIAMVVGEEKEAHTEEGGSGEGEAGGVPKAGVFYDLPELLVNLNTGGRKSSFLKIRVALELQKQEDVPVMEAVMPRIIDNFQVYLRELRIEDLKGSMGVYRLKEELLTRVNAAVAPAKVNDVLFKEMLVQ